MLSFELVRDGRAIQIHCDSQGMGRLLEALARLMKERSGHIHLWGPSMGREDLDEVSPFGDPAFCEVMIDYQEGDPLTDDDGRP